MCVHVYNNLYIYIYKCMYMYTYIFIHTHTHVYKYIYIYNIIKKPLAKTQTSRSKTTRSATPHCTTLHHATPHYTTHCNTLTFGKDANIKIKDNALSSRVRQIMLVLGVQVCHQRHHIDAVFSHLTKKKINTCQNLVTLQKKNPKKNAS